jgi:hypothetical protein
MGRASGSWGRKIFKGNEIIKTGSHRMVRSYISMVFITTCLCVNVHGQGDSIIPAGGYPGQEPPGTTPELFAPAIMTSPQGYHSPISFSPDMREAIWRPMLNENVIYYSRIESGRWSTPERIGFGEEFDVLDPFFSPDGNRIWFLSFHPDRPGGSERERIWYAERSSDGWTPPKLIDDCVNAHPTHWSFSVSAGGNLYFTSEIAGEENQDVYCSKFDGEKYLFPVKLGPQINTDAKEFAPFVSPDESYLLFCRIGSGTGKSDIYLSFRQPDGTWSEAIALDKPVNSKEHELAPRVSPGGKYLFYISQKEVMNGMHWVSAKIIKELRQKIN